jgi:hypothetical protein
VIAVGLALFVSCGRSGESSVDSAVSSARDLTLAPGAELKISSPVQRDRLGFSAAWELEARQDWSDYKRVVLTRLLPEYALSTEGEGEIFLHRHVDGDTYTLRLVLGSRGPPLRLRAVLQAYPS